MPTTISVKQAAARVGCTPATYRRGILQGELPGVAIRCGEKTKFVIPEGSVDIFMETGLTPTMLAREVMRAETPEQALAYLRAALEKR